MTTYPQSWLDAAAESAHKALDDVDDGWHYSCTTDEPRECFKGDRARAMLAQDVMPEVLKALAAAGALKEITR